MKSTVKTKIYANIITPSATFQYQCVFQGRCCGPRCWQRSSSFAPSPTKPPAHSGPQPPPPARSFSAAASPDEVKYAIFNSRRNFRVFYERTTHTCEAMRVFKSTHDDDDDDARANNSAASELALVPVVDTRMRNA